MLKKTLIVAALTAAFAAHAQAPAAPAPAAPAAAAAPSPAKKALITRILKDQQGAIEGIARSLAQQPALEVMGDARNALAARVPKDKQDEVAKAIQADVKKYVDEAVPLAQQQAVKIAPTTVGTLLSDKFTEDELKQLVGILESPVYAKYQGLGDEMNKALADKLVADTRSQIEPKVRTMEQSVAKHLGITTSGAPQNGAPRAAKPASR